jgi:hypothetical protein
MQSELWAFIQQYISSDHNPNHPLNRWQRYLPEEKLRFASITEKEYRLRLKRFDANKLQLFDRRIVTVSSYKGSR